MKKKKLFIVGILILALIPLSIHLFSDYWSCNDIPIGCGGTSYCIGDTMENGVCELRCKTGDTYTRWKRCYQVW